MVTAEGSRTDSGTWTGLLEGVLILDLSMFVAGPFATMILADLGADVIKIEPMGGDPVRNSGIGPEIRGEAAQFHTYNRNKKSLCLDLKATRGRELFYELAGKADVVFDNFRPGVLERLQLDYQSLREVNPSIICVSLSGFGQDGPWAERPGYDIIVQALSGTMSLTGHDAADPAAIPLHFGDTSGGLYAALTMAAALSHRDRTGEGRHLELSLLDCQLAMLGDEVTNLGATGEVPQPHGASHPYLVPYTAFQTQDRPIVIAAVGVEKFFANLAAAVGKPELADDPRFRDNRSRIANRNELEETLREIFETRTRDAWIETLIEHDVPAAPVLDVAEAMKTPQARHRQMTESISLSNGESARVARSPVRVAGASSHPLNAAPERNEHGRKIIGDLLGYTEADIKLLIDEGVIG